MPRMKVITIRQPCATLLVLGVKQYETRTWRTNHRGEVAIHAGTKLHRSARELIRIDDVANLIGTDLDALPRGALIGTMNLEDCIRGDEAVTTELERKLGYFTENHWVWRMTPRRTFKPVPMLGQQGFWNITDNRLPTPTRRTR